MMQRLKNIYQYREMIYSLVKRDLRGRYQKSILGFLWTLINPLCQILVFTVVFTYVFKSGIENYYLFLTISMIPWSFFSETVGQGAAAVVANGDMLKKIYFPREVLPISLVTARFVNMIMAFVIVFGAVIVSGIGVNPKALLFLPIVMICEYILVLGFSLIFSSITVYLRDMEYIVSVLLMAWLWGTPVMYNMDAVPAFLEPVIMLNPMTRIILAYREILFNKQVPVLNDLIIAFLCAAAILIVGEIIFARLDKNFAEEL